MDRTWFSVKRDASSDANNAFQLFVIVATFSRNLPALCMSNGYDKLMLDFALVTTCSCDIFEMKV